jgi:crotonobetainyl-CoA:carnitine CoA-transferase CaiB-like acyl-CoA transferase
MTPDSLTDWWTRGGLTAPTSARFEVTGVDPVLPARHRVGEMAAAALGLVGARAAELSGRAEATVRVDVAAAAASLQGFLRQHLDPPGPTLRARDATTAFYRAGDDRWIHLHGGFEHLGDGLLDVLGLSPDNRGDAELIGAAVDRWEAAALEDALAERGLCAAMVRTPTEWADHPQGRAVATEPAVDVERIDDADGAPSSALDGLRVLDLTRVLAGPTCGRTLALFGADVLRVGAARLPSIEPFVVDTGAGKRNAFLDLADADDAATDRRLVEGADVVVCGYRPGALDRYGFGPDDLFALRPGLVLVLVDCYGHSGPWAGRPGWEQLAQSAGGIAHVEGGDAPQLLPAAATDYTTGYLAAAGVLDALARRRSDGGSYVVRASLCATAHWLSTAGADLDPAAATGVDPTATITMDTDWGRLTRLAPPLTVDGLDVRWRRSPAPLGSSPPRWDDGDGQIG